MSWLDSHARRKFSLGEIASPAEPEINLIPFIHVNSIVMHEVSRIFAQLHCESMIRSGEAPGAS